MQSEIKVYDHVKKIEICHFKYACFILYLEPYDFALAGYAIFSKIIAIFIAWINYQGQNFIVYM